MLPPFASEPWGTPLSEEALKSIAEQLALLVRHAERSAPPEPAAPDFESADAFVWQPAGHRLQPVTRVSRVDLSLLRGVDRMRDILLDNTERFARGLPANNVLLWGARGMGKSSLVKAAHAAVNQMAGVKPAKLIEIHREDIETLPELMGLLRDAPYRVILFCDDLSFDGDDASYKSLKAALEGGIEGRPENVVFYATSNRRHLLPRDMMENERSTAINPHEAVEEKVSLSDRFGLWLGFHNADQDTFFTMIEGYCDFYGLDIPRDELRKRAVEWSITRGSRSGRVAWQFIQEIAGELGKKLG